MNMRLRRERLPSSESRKSKTSIRLRIAALILRGMFIVTLVVIAARVSIPQSEHIWSAYETPGDLLRLMLGLGFCVWVLFHMFRLQEDADAHRTWVYFGLVAVPCALICLIAVW